MRYIGVVGEGRGIGNHLLARACERCVISLPCSTLEGFAEISYSNSRPISIVSASISSSFQCDREMRKHKPFAGHVQTIRFVNWRCQPRSQGLPSSHKREWLLALLQNRGFTSPDRLQNCNASIHSDSRESCKIESIFFNLCSNE